MLSSPTIIVKFILSFFPKTIALMFGVIYFQLKLDQAGVQDINGVVFLLVTNTSFANMFPVLNSFVPLITLILRENKNGLYRIINLFVSKTLVEVNWL
jgi:hypothetical protein